MTSPNVVANRRCDAGAYRRRWGADTPRGRAIRPRPSARAQTASVLLAAALLGGGCVSSPPQTIELADVVLEEMAQIERAHRQLVRAYFAQLDAQVESFIATRWTPDFLDRSLQDESVTARLEALQSGANVDAADVRQALIASGTLSEPQADAVMRAIDRSRIDYRVGLSRFMIDFADAATREIGAVRRDWQQRLREGERNFMAALDESYGALRAGHLTIRTYLESVADVTRAQDRVATELGLLGMREHVLDEAASASDDLAGGVAALNRVLDTLEKEAPDPAIPLDAGVLQGVLERLEREPDPTEP